MTALNTYQYVIKNPSVLQDNFQPRIWAQCWPKDLAAVKPKSDCLRKGIEYSTYYTAGI